MTNVVMIHTHDTGRYIEPYGYPVATPNLQQFAESATVFRNAYCAGPTCSPSRGALLTGSHPHSNGLIGLAHRGFELDDHDQHLANYLGDRGYETALSGIHHESSGTDEQSGAERLGYQTHLTSSAGTSDDIDDDLDDNEYDDDDEAAVQAAAEFIRADHDDPYFLFCGLFRTHRPFDDGGSADGSEFVRPPAPLPDVAPIREDVAQFRATAARADEQVGTVLDALVDSGADEDTVVIYTTDHGIPFPGMKCRLRDQGIGVSLLMRFPDDRLDRGVVDGLVSHVDVFPTLCEYLDVPTPEWVEGQSVLPVLSGAQDAVRDAVFAGVTYHASYEPMRCVRTDRYKYVERFDDEQGVPLANVDPCPSKEFLLEHGLGDQPVAERALYDLYHDSNEQDNVVADARYADVANELSRRLREWMHATEDPLLDGPVPKPEGATVNVHECTEPTESRYETAGLR